MLVPTLRDANVLLGYFLIFALFCQFLLFFVVILGYAAVYSFYFLLD